MTTVQLPDGSEKTYTSPCTVHQVAESISSRLANAAIAGKIDDTVVGLDTTLPEDTICRVQILTYIARAGCRECVCVCDES